MNGVREVNLVARPTIYRGIQMRSRLEATYAASLDAGGIEWLYEPRAYANSETQYLPDFQLVSRDGVPYDHLNFVEVRPTIERAYLAMPRMAVIWDSEPEAFLIIEIPDVLSFVAPGWLWPRKWHARA